MKRIFLVASLTLALFSCTKQNQEIADKIIPQPNSVEVSSGTFNVAAPTVVLKNYPDEQGAELIFSLIKSVFPDAKRSSEGGDIELTLQESETSIEGSYTLNITSKKIDVNADNAVGILYAVQTIKQLDELNGDEGIPAMLINDKPRFSYRGLHIDVSRHFYNADFIKKQLDIMSYYKLNRFHWHLTDGAGWRIEIKSYPKLTEIAAWRPYENWKDFWYNGRKYCHKDDPKAQGGYYTQEEIKDVVAYAAKLGITVLPEIEMPGHSEELLAVYPNLSCSGKPYVNGEVCAGNEATFEFFENVLTEVIELFPSEYIHIGGDEADKNAWKKCPKCQARIKKEGLKDEFELQSYFIKRIEKFLHSKGRKLIGWDEIIEGGLSKSATVMAWRSEHFGIEAAEQGNDVIMSPGDYCYFDKYQDNPITEPEAIGGFIPLSAVYGYEPVSDTLAVDVANKIIGVQANLWTEYMPTEEHLEYMIYPRLLALAEVGWSEPTQKSWDRFVVATNYHVALLNQKGYNSHPIAKNVSLVEEVDLENKAIKVSFDCDLTPVQIRYTLDGSDPIATSTQLKTPIVVTDSAIIKVAAFQNDEQKTNPQTFKTYYHKAVGKSATYNLPFCKHYKASKEASLTDGYSGGASYGDGRWQGFRGDIDIVIDLGEVTEFSQVTAKFMQQAGPWIWFPVTVDISISQDGENYTPLKHIDNDIPRDTEGIDLLDFGYNDAAVSARYIQYKAHQKPLDGAYMFVDEIVVR